MPINPKIFKAYDVRGRFPEEINEEVVYSLSRAFASFLRDKYPESRPSLILGRDGRLSSPQLYNAALRGAKDEGGEVISIGIVTTPLFGWSVSHKKADGGMMITASHNPKEFNGIKFVGRGAISIGESSGLKEISKFVLSNPTSDSRKGKVRDEDVISEYVDFVTKGVTLGPLRFVLDASNGTVAKLLEQVMERVGDRISFHRLNWEQDGNFTGHGPDPLAKGATDDAAAKIQEVRAHGGVVFDADADRIIFLNEKGKIIQADYITAFLASRYLAQHPGRKIVYDIPSSRIVHETIVSNEGVAVESRVGHSFVKEAMRKEKALFGGEHSGHYFYESMGYSWADMLPFLDVMAILSREKMPFSVLIKPFQKYVQSGEINLPISDWVSLKEKIKSEFKDARLSFLDGISIAYPSWWANVRLSQTEALVRVNVEAHTQVILNAKVALIKQVMS